MFEGVCGATLSCLRVFEKQPYRVLGATLSCLRVFEEQPDV